MLKIIGRLEPKLSSRVWPKGANCSSVIGFFVDYSDISIPLNTIFKTIYFKKEIIAVNCKLIYVTNQTFLPFEFLEEGYKTISFFEFDELPEILDGLPFVDNWYDYDDIFDVAIFSQNEIEYDCED